MPPGPDPEQARADYDRAAADYDSRFGQRVVAGLRNRAIELLDLKPGDRVLDIACGTGAAFDAIEERIGPDGELVGVDLSLEMLARAADRVRAHEWENVRLVEGRVEEADLGDEPFDAALSSFTHDVLQSEAAVERIADALKPGDGRVAATSIKWAPRWNLPVNAAVAVATRPYITTRDGLGEPWRKLAAHLEDVEVERRWLGSMYVMTGRRART